jgi:hypothetical protein
MHSQQGEFVFSGRDKVSMCGEISGVVTFLELRLAGTARARPEWTPSVIIEMLRVGSVEMYLKLPPVL